MSSDSLSTGYFIYEVRQLHMFIMAYKVFYKKNSIDYAFLPQQRLYFFPLPQGQGSFGDILSFFIAWVAL